MRSVSNSYKAFFTTWQNVVGAVLVSQWFAAIGHLHHTALVVSTICFAAGIGFSAKGYEIYNVKMDKYRDEDGS